jgi:hypothetical protein
VTVASVSLLPLLKPESAFEGAVKSMGGTRDDELPGKCSLSVGLREESRQHTNVIQCRRSDVLELERG